MYFVYILKNHRNQIYIGSAANIELRLIRHSNGEGAEFTKRNKDFKLIYSESYPSLIAARRREKQIKGWRREKKENLIKYGKSVI